MKKFVTALGKTGSHQIKRGFTIMEIMIVIIIVAVAVTGVALSMGASKSANLHSSSWMLVSAVKYAYSRAVSSGSTVRIVLDFSENTIQLQETFGRVVLNRDDETGVGLNREKYEDEYKADGSVEEHSLSDKMKNIGPVVTGQSVSSGTGDVTGSLAGEMAISDPFLKSLQDGMAGAGIPHYKGPRFEVIEGSRGEKRPLKKDIRFLKVFSPHAPEPIEEGFAFIYFFPTGMTEHTYIQLTDSDEDDPHVKTVIISPLSGRTVIHHEAVEPDMEDLSDVQEGEQ
ncbi:MAG: prepilin-type N-terminal cleavage/methylation domain-containing protein [Deltaproteobacteria bacterium]|nr:prepilin-type N-terminal cleavage/methylation domain-containing protein [Deltaproteobacteria bacterium]